MQAAGAAQQPAVAAAPAATAAGDPPALLSDLPQPESEGAGHCPDRVRHVEACRTSAPTRKCLGKNSAEGSHRPDAALRPAASRQGGARRLRERDGIGAGRRRGSASESGTNGAVPSAESRRIQERHPRSARSRRQRRLAASRRRCQLRVRQHRRRPEDVADAHGAVSGRGAEDQPSRGRHAAAGPQRRLRSPRRRSPAGRAHRGAAHRHARRRVDSATRSRWTPST